MLSYLVIMVAVVKTVAPVGFSGHMIEVESNSSNGLPSFQIVGLGNKAIDEARESARSAINNSMLGNSKEEDNYQPGPC